MSALVVFERGGFEQVLIGVYGPFASFDEAEARCQKWRALYPTNFSVRRVDDDPSVFHGHVADRDAVTPALREALEREVGPYVLDALLAVEVAVPCETCEEVGLVTVDGPAGVPHTVECPDCDLTGSRFVRLGEVSEPKKEK